MEYLKFCWDYWWSGGTVNLVILLSSFFIGIFYWSRRYTKNFTNLMIGVVPLLGLLGTVVGMIDTFNALQRAGADVQGLSYGISKAMITTASGLCVAIFGTCILPFKKDKDPEPYTEEQLSKMSIEQLEEIVSKQNSPLIDPIRVNNVIQKHIRSRIINKIFITNLEGSFYQFVNRKRQ